MESKVTNQEIMFLWDASMCNPNGDMAADNAPRFDEVDEKAIVSDVRIKRTIRDDLQYRKNMGEQIFINNEVILSHDNEETVTAERMFDLLKAREENKEKAEKEVFLSCIDNRLFGGVAPKSGLQLVGPVQFSWTKSLNETETILKSGTGAFATKPKDDKEEAKFKKTFRADNYLPYALFAMYGTVNAQNAAQCETTEEDVMLMLDSLWYGTKFLNTRSKMGQKPRLLIRIKYKKESKYFIGLLDELVSLGSAESKMVRSVAKADAGIDFSKLIKAINQAESFIDEVEVVYDSTMEEYLEALKGIENVTFIDDVAFAGKSSKDS